MPPGDLRALWCVRADAFGAGSGLGAGRRPSVPGLCLAPARPGVMSACVCVVAGAGPLVSGSCCEQLGVTAADLAFARWREKFKVSR